MQNNNVIDSKGAALAAPAKAVWRSSGRRMIYGVCVALLGGATLAISTAGTSQVPARLAVSSIEGNVIVAFDSPAHAIRHPQYRVDCSAVSGGTVNAWAEADSSPVVVGGLAAGEEYDCRASLTADAGTSKSVRVRVMGQD